MLPGVLAVATLTLLAVLLLWVESQTAVLALLLIAGAVVLSAAKLGWLSRVQASFAEAEGSLNVATVIGVLVVAAVFHEDHFALLMVATVLLYILACLGLNIQFGYAGLLNFAGAAFFGIGCYTAAVLTVHSALPHLLVLLAGGLTAALIGSLLLYPVLRTRGHYAAVITIAFALLFRTFLEVNDVLGGPQGLRVEGTELFGWPFNSNIELGSFEDQRA